MNQFQMLGRGPQMARTGTRNGTREGVIARPRDQLHELAIRLRCSGKVTRSHEQHSPIPLRHRRPGRERGTEPSSLASASSKACKAFPDSLHA